MRLRQMCTVHLNRLLILAFYGISWQNRKSQTNEPLSCLFWGLSRFPSKQPSSGWCIGGRKYFSSIIFLLGGGKGEGVLLILQPDTTQQPRRQHQTLHSAVWSHKISHHVDPTVLWRTPWRGGIWDASHRNAWKHSVLRAQDQDIH